MVLPIQWGWKWLVKMTGKRLKKGYEGLDRLAIYSLADALAHVKKAATAKLDETIEVAARLGVDPRHADQMVRGAIVLPNGTGKTLRVAVFSRDAKANEALEAGADVVGAEDLAEKMEKGDLNFDRVIASPDMMAIVGRLGRILGPRGLMPNPKLGTVTPDIKKAVQAAKGGQIQYRVEKAGIVQAGIGKASFTEKALEENVRTFMDALVKGRPSGAKGTYLLSASVSSTMGIGLKFDTSDFK